MVQACDQSCDVSLDSSTKVLEKGSSQGSETMLESDLESAQSSPQEVAEYQILEQTNPTIAPHTCSHCKKIVLDYPIECHSTVGYSVQLSFPAFEVSLAKAEGCLLFQQYISDGLDQTDPKRTIWRSSMTATHSAVQQRNSRMENVYRRIRFKFWNDGISIHDESQSSAHFDVYLAPGDRPISPSDISCHIQPNLVPESELCYIRTRKWLEECNHARATCRKFRGSYMPKRLLKIRGGPATLVVKLVTTSEKAGYAALSYCWGADQPAKTIKALLAAYKHSISLDSLPQTIQDAVTFTRGIGLEYLWVDAMRIVQDDGDDKEEQITHMHQIYRSSAVTLVAAVASTCNDGFLHPRTSYRPLKVKLRTDDSTFVDRILLPKTQSGGTSRISGRSTHRLYRRAWTLQEVNLSSRVVTLRSRETVFCCLEAKLSDGGIPDSYGMRNHLTAGNRQMTDMSQPLSWTALVELYAERGLSVESDKLLAIAGLAEAYSQSRPVTDYLAGLWRENFLLQCLWSSRHDGFQMWYRRPSKYRTPSWSWASLDGGVHHTIGSSLLEGSKKAKKEESGKDVELSCSLIDVQTDLHSSTSPLGQVIGGHMTVRGKVKQAIWKNKGIDGHMMVRDIGESPRGPEGRSSFAGMPSIRIDVLHEWRPSSEVLIWCLEICHGRSLSSDGEEDGQGLVLLPVVGMAFDHKYEEIDTFKRIGYFSIMGCMCSESDTDGYRKLGYWFDEEFEWKEITII